MDGSRIGYSERIGKIADIDADLTGGKLRVPAPVDLDHRSALTGSDDNLSFLSDLMDSDRRCASDLFSAGKKQADELIRGRKNYRLTEAGEKCIMKNGQAPGLPVF